MKIFVRSMKRTIGAYLKFLTAKRIAALRPHGKRPRPQEYPPGQWHRWHKHNTRWQRRLRAMRQMGHRIPPNITSLRRDMIA